MRRLTPPMARHRGSGDRSGSKCPTGTDGHADKRNSPSDVLAISGQLNLFSGGNPLLATPKEPPQALYVDPSA